MMALGRGRVPRVSQTWPWLAVLLLGPVTGIVAQRAPPALVMGVIAGVGLAVWAVCAEPIAVLTALLLLRPVVDVVAGTDFVTVASLSRVGTDEALNAAGILGLGVIALCPFHLWRPSTRGWGHRTPGPSPLPGPAAAFGVLVAWAAVTLPFAEDRTLAATNLLRVMSVICFALLVWRACASVDGWRALCRAMALSAAVPTLVAFQQLATGTGGLIDTTGTTEVNRAVGTLGNPNPFAHYLVLTLLATCALLDGTRGWRRWLWLGLAGLQAIALGATFTRGAWLAAAVALAVLLLTGGLRHAWRWLLIVSVVFGVLLLLNADTLDARFANLDSSNLETNSAASRLAIWQSMLAFLATSSRIVTGFGVGSVTAIADRYLQLPLVTHNDYLRVLVELGAVGLLIWVGVFVAAAVGLTARLRAARGHTKERLAAAIGLAALAAYFTGGWVENLFTLTSFQWYWWVLILAPLAIRLPPPSALGYFRGSSGGSGTGYAGHFRRAP